MLNSLLKQASEIRSQVDSLISQVNRQLGTGVERRCPTGCAYSTNRTGFCPVCGEYIQTVRK